MLEDSGQILSRANQALATLERYKLRLDEVSSTLSALEIEDLVTVRDVAVVAQRLEMVTRIAREIEDYVLELGTDGRLLVAPARGAGHRRRPRARAGDPRLPARRAAARKGARGRCSPSSRRCRRPTWSTPPSAPARSASALGEHLDGAVAPRGYRLLAKVPRLPGHRRRPAGRPLRHPAEAALRRHRRPPGRRRRRRAAGPQRPRGPVPPRRVERSSSATSDLAASAKPSSVSQGFRPGWSGCWPGRAEGAGRASDTCVRAR